MPVLITCINTKKGPVKHLIVAQKITILCVLRKGNQHKYEFGHFEMTPEFQTHHVIGNPRELANRELGFPADMMERLLARQGFANKE